MFAVFIIIMILMVGAIIGVYHYLTDFYQSKLNDQEVEFARREKQIRADAISRSDAVNIGKTMEHIAPFTANFPIDSKDVTFLGMPIDYVGFTNTNSKTKCQVHFIEVKTGTSTLTTKQRNIKNAIEEGRVTFSVVTY